MVDVTRPSGAVSTVLGFSFNDDALGAVHAASLAPILAGEHHFGGAFYFAVSPSFDELVPDDFAVVNDFTGLGCAIRYARSADGWLGILVERRARSTFVRVTGAVDDAVQRLVADLRAKEEEASLRERDVQRYRLWHLGRRGPEARSMKFPAVTWDSVARNYAGPTRALLDELVAVERPEGQGRLILWRGEPGTGKTRAVQALAKEWSAWCDVHYVTDSEDFFDSPDYLMRVALDTPDATDDEADEDQRWRLVVAEDADEYLQIAGGRKSSGALGRLLNLCDGLLGQGANLLVLLTTNQDVGRLDPALTRPGRCLSFVEFDPFPLAEARAWLGVGAGEVSGPMTLAELYERRREGAQIMATVADFRAGTYL